MIRKILAGSFAVLVFVATAGAAEIKVLTAGAMKSVVMAIAPDFEKATSHKLIVDNDTTGGLIKRIEGGEVFDLAIITPAALSDLGKKNLVANASPLARVGVGVVVKAGAPKPDISTVEDFKKALLNAKSVAYIDPASGGTSGIYVAKLLEQLGIAEAIKPKTKLKKGGYVAELIASGEAELGIHQISEILPVPGVWLVGPLPAEIQSHTIYSAGVSPSAKQPEAAKALAQWLLGPATTAVLATKGMDRPPS